MERIRLADDIAKIARYEARLAGVPWPLMEDLLVLELNERGDPATITPADVAQIARRLWSILS